MRHRDDTKEHQPCVNWIECIGDSIRREMEGIEQVINIDPPFEAGSGGMVHKLYIRDSEGRARKFSVYVKELRT